MIYCDVQAGQSLMAQCIMEKLRNKSTGEVNTAVTALMYFFLSIMHCQYFKLYHCFCLSCDLCWNLRRFSNLIRFNQFYFFCSVLYFCNYPSTVEKKGEKILDLILNQKKKQKKYMNKNLSKNQITCIEIHGCLQVNRVKKPI